MSAPTQTPPTLNGVLLTLDLPGIPKLRSGKVRELFDLGGTLLMVATDRISAFDVIMPNGIPNKGRVLTALSAFWFAHTQHIIANHALTTRVEEFPKQLQPFRDKIAGRSMLVKKARPLPIECVVRGYLSGSGWKEYKKSRAICGIRLPSGLVESAELPEPIFTPATKAQSGHDVNITLEQAAALVGEAIAKQARDASLAIYKWARDYARQRGIIIADTKFEFGIHEGKLILIDEVLTPDSSRFWPADQYKPGGAQPSFDKQFLRDYLETLDWDKTPPAPQLPEEITRKTGEKYLEAFRLITGKTLETI
jgi:phosphoribosylaminoimidazole-succinocarboxamide synthase